MVPGTTEVRNKFLTYFFLFWDLKGKVKSYIFLLFKLSTALSNSCSTFYFSLATFLKLFPINCSFNFTCFIVKIVNLSVYYFKFSLFISQTNFFLFSRAALHFEQAVIEEPHIFCVIFILEG